MIKGVSKKDNLLLLISEHKALSGICAFIEFIRLKMGFSKEFNELIKNALDVFQKDKNHSGGVNLREVWGILYSHYRYMIAPKEYFMYNFRALNDYGRSEFVGIRRLFLVWRKLWDPEICKIYDNKFFTYQTYKKYYGREVISISSDSDFSEFYAFTQRHDHFIVKPLDDYGGNGIHIMQVSSREEALAEFNEIRAAGEAVVEELVVQDPDMARFNPDSVNTIRFVTFYYKGRLTKICAALRMGRNGSKVDNATYGGIFATIDIEYGIVYTYAESFKGEKYAVHPDTGVQILGAKIPNWEELNSLVEELVKVVPQQKMVGWDLALTPAGWVVIEANHNPCTQEFVLDHGLREIMHDFYEAYYE